MLHWLLTGADYCGGSWKAIFKAVPFGSRDRQQPQQAADCSAGCPAWSRGFFMARMNNEVQTHLLAASIVAYCVDGPASLLKLSQDLVNTVFPALHRLEHLT